MQVERRREKRRTVNATYYLGSRQEGAPADPLEVVSLDISALGIRVCCSTRLTPGAEIYIKGKSGRPAGLCTVRYSVQRGAEWHIGLEFSAELRDSLPAFDDQNVDYYEFLQISPKAEKATIHRIYRFMASRFHPDNPETGDLEKFLLLQRAFEVLSNPEQRAEYDAMYQNRETEAIPIFELSEFVNGIEGEINRRLGVLALLYNKRRTNPSDPTVSLRDLEKQMAFPREYLDFTTWYLKAKQYITVADNSDFALTALGVDYIEANVPNNPTLTNILENTAQTATGAMPRKRSRSLRSTAGLFQMGAARPDGAIASGASESKWLAAGS